jgi:alkanesulfonate monooxygenase SsuD/methylene tetrahydromethanopterin reductase-like flavin-dependent oxidoreductase (luciferase family)
LSDVPSARLATSCHCPASIPSVVRDGANALRWIVLIGLIPSSPPTASLDGVPNRRFRFGVTGRGDSLAQWRDFARKAEDRGYSTLLLPDHFGPRLAATDCARCGRPGTRTLRPGTLVLDHHFRHTAVLAKEAATLDLLTEGRVELGIGSG